MATTAVSLIQRLHQHRAWVNQNLLAAAADLSDKQLHQTFAIGQGSIWKSLAHLYAAEFVWLETLLGDENPVAPGDMRGRLPGNQLGADKIQSLAELQQKWNDLAKRWSDYLATLTPEALEQTVYKISASINAGQRLGNRRSDVLLHLCTHAQYTVAQIVNMLRQLGVEKLPETMLISLVRREATA